MENELIWVCLACGKMSQDFDGHKPLSRGWTGDCSQSARQFARDELIIMDDRVVGLKLSEPDLPKAS